MKKLSSLIFASLFVALTSPVAVFGQTDTQRKICENDALPHAACETGNSRSLADGVLGTALEILSYVIGTASVIVIVVAGLMYVFSGGDPKNTTRAKDAILYAVIGVVVAIAAQAIVRVVLSQL